MWIVLDGSAAALVLGLLLAAIYELVALVTHGKLITDLVRPWIDKHSLVATTIAAIWIGATAWFLLHFYLPK